MTETDLPPDEGLRLRALHTALAAIGAEGKRLLQEHPELDRIAPPRSIEPLEWLQWDELEELLAACDAAGGISRLRRSPESYIVERRHLSQISAWRVAVSRMPAFWREALQLDAERAGVVMTRIGLELVIRAARVVERAELERWLAPLGASHARNVAGDLIARRKREPEPFAEAARRAFEDEAATARGGRLAARLGRRAFAAALAGVSPEVRGAAERAARSNLLALLERTPPLEVAGEADAKALTRLLEAGLAKGGTS